MLHNLGTLKLLSTPFPVGHGINRLRVEEVEAGTLVRCLIVENHYMTRVGWSLRYYLMPS